MLARLIAYAAGMVRRRRIDAEVDDELRFHLAQEIDAHVARGVPLDEARRRALRDLGGMNQTREAVQDVRTIWLDAVWSDVRYACRTFIRAKGFALVAVVTLAVGIAGATAMFAVVEAVLLRPLPVRDQDRILVAWRHLAASPSRQWSLSYSDVRILDEESRTLDLVAGYGSQDPVTVAVVEAGEAVRLNLARVTGDFFQVLGVDAVAGRTLTANDDEEGAEPVVVIAHAFWQRKYGSSREAIGRRLVINEQTFVVVGVASPAFEFPRGVDVWVPVRPLAATVREEAFREAVVNELKVVARLAPGTAATQAAAELAVLGPRLGADAPPGAPQGLLVATRSFVEEVVGDVRAPVMLLFAAVALVLLIATANVANLLLMRGESRRPEWAVRSALGAGPWRIAGQLLTESLVLAGAAGALGLVATWGALPVLIALVPDGLPRVSEVEIDGSVAFFAMAAAFAASALAAGWPARTAGRAGLAAQFGGGARTVAGSPAGRVGRGLVVVQFVLAVSVVAATALLTRSLWRLNTVGSEMAADRLVSASLAMPGEKYANPIRRLQFFDAATARLESRPDVVAATPVNVEPFSGIGWDVPSFAAEGQSRDEAYRNPSLNLEAVHPSYFRTFEIDVVRGRSFTDADRTRDRVAGDQMVAILSHDIAARTWPGEDPIGKRLKMGPVDSEGEWWTVVGLATPTRYRDVREARPTMYVPAAGPFVASTQMLVVRAAEGRALGAEEMVRAIEDVDPAVRVLRVVSFRDLLARPLARPRFQAVLIAAFGAVAILLAAVGLYAAMAMYVRLRQQEISIRLSLGATSAQIRRLVWGEGGRLVLAGLVVGLAIATGATQALRGLLFEVSPLDPLAMLSTVAILIIAAGAACYAPVRRACRMDPVVLLRGD